MKRVVRWVKSLLNYSDRRNPHVDVEDFYIEHWGAVIRDKEIYNEEFEVQVGDSEGNIHRMFCRITDVESRTIAAARGVSLEVVHILGMKPIKLCTQKEFRELYYDILSNEMTIIISTDDRRRYYYKWRERQNVSFPAIIKASY